MLTKAQPDLKYSLHLEPDLKNFTFKGEVTITLSTGQVKNSYINLDAQELQIFHCRAHAGTHATGSNWVDCTFELKTNEAKLIIQIPDTLTQQKTTHLQINIQYAGFINDSLAGFYRSQYLDRGEKKYLAVTQFEEKEARRALPCFDQPACKAVFDIEFLIPQELQGIANTPLKEELKQPDHKKLLRFQTTPPMSTYLLFFGIGDFEIKEKKTDHLFRIITTPGKTQYGDFGLDFSVKALRYGEEYTAIPFPIGKMDLIAVPDFAYGAMENYGAVTFRENLLLFYPGISSKASLERIAEIIAHEFAHMWFGNLVSPKDWRFIWLNESFATIFGYIIADHYFPEWEMGETFVSTVTSRAMSRDALHETIPVELPEESKIVINTATSPIIYSKGACILRMLQGYLGTEAFQKGTRHFLKTFAFGCASSAEYWKTFGEATQIPLNEIMAGWIHNPGFPLVNVTKEKNTLIFSQKRFTYLPNNFEQDTWWIPINVLLLDEKENALETKKLILKEKITRLTLPEDAVYYKINPEQTGFFITQYDQETFKTLGKLIASKKLSALDRYGLHNDFHALLMAGNFDLDDYLDFLRFYDEEDSFHPLINISQALAHLYLVLDKKRPAIASCGQKLLATVLTKAGLEPQDEEPHTLANLRDVIIWISFLFGDEKVATFAVKQFNNWLNGSSVHPDILSSVLKIGARLRPAEAYTAFINRLESAQAAEHEKINILSALGCFADEKYLLKALDYTLTHVPSKNKYIPIANAGFNSTARPCLWDWYKKNITTLEQFYPVHYERVISSIIPYTGLEHTAEVQAFYANYPLKAQYLDTINMALELLTINLSLKKREEQT